MAAMRAGAAAVAFQHAGTAVTARRDSRRMGTTGETDLEGESEEAQREAESRLTQLEAEVANIKAAMDENLGLLRQALQRASGVDGASTRTRPGRPEVI